MADSVEKCANYFGMMRRSLLRVQVVNGISCSAERFVFVILVFRCFCLF